MSNGLAIISGTGALPRVIAEVCKESNQPYYVVLFKGTDLDWVKGHPVIETLIERPGKLIKELKKKECDQVVFAGAMRRPNVNPLKLDTLGMKLVSKVLSNSKTGDDATLRAIVEVFENEGIIVRAAQDVAPDILPNEGVLTKLHPTEHDKSDVERAKTLVATLGELDVGQGAVVAQGLCLALETIQGTDVMLEFVANNRDGFTSNTSDAKGVLYKAAKPKQDLRVDLPAIGPKTITNVHQAGLAGVAIQSRAVMILEREKTISLANELGVFIWVAP